MILIRTDFIQHFHFSVNFAIWRSCVVESTFQGFEQRKNWGERTANWNKIMQTCFFRDSWHVNVLLDPLRQFDVVRGVGTGEARASPEIRAFTIEKFSDLGYMKGEIVWASPEKSSFRPPWLIRILLQLSFFWTIF